MHISTFFLGATIGILTNIEAVSALPQPIDGGGLHKIVNNVPVIGKILGKFLPQKPQRPDFCLEWYLDKRDKATRDASDGHVFNPGTMPLPTTSLQEIFDVCQNRHRMPINVKNPANKALLAQRLAWCTKYRCDDVSLVGIFLYFCSFTLAELTAFSFFTFKPFFSSSKNSYC